MNDLEKNKLLEIKELRERLINSTKYDVAIPNVYPSEPSGNTFAFLAQQIFNKVVELNESCHPEYINNDTIVKLQDVIEDEVDLVRRKYSEVLKPNSAKKRKNEMYNLMDVALFHIDMHLQTLYKVFDEL